MTPALVLFDIDGTLIHRAGPHHRQALVDAVREVTGVETTTDGIPVQGMLDPDILSVMLSKAGISTEQADRVMPAILEQAQQLYIASVPDLQDKTCPGTRELLAQLQAREILLALVTGNLTRIGWRKLERAGLRQFFRYGAFADMARDRSQLAARAIAQARAEYGIAPSTPITLVGDAPPDILAARANGIQSIAVCTGVTPRAELAALHPDLLVEDLRELTTDVFTRTG